ncbi:PREDICTED: uncharacterized protein LOC107194549 [Dufourea novaeangliae]|uniref:uncharacterized protein LOC107194549 n=1 Tax=Dufourea novaeangliae TaxID=178035 RepID=UPI0007673A35|nr:PREDICTED: uncharacterized protein LOC107194549 [Dufourea novaeangliae]
MAVDTVLVQQVDFLETILEETSDDLQSDSDRSGTTYWVGSDSETESVIHIRAKLKLTDERLDGSGSDCNSVVPKKRRRRNNGTSDRDHQVPFEDYPASPRSSRSSASSRSSSLLQFESLERTCATLSPSSYSFDSLEYSNRSNISHLENTSPDSLEQDYDKLVPNDFPNVDHFSRIRPYRSFESLDTCQKNDEFGPSRLTNGFAPLYLKRNSDLSRIRRNGHRPSRDFWHEDEEYEDDEDEEDLDEEEEDLDEEEDRLVKDNRAGSEIEDRLMVFGDQTCNYAASVDYRNTIDLREIGVESKRDALLDLKSGQAAVSSSFRLLQTKLNIAGSMVRGRNNTVADHHHHHHHHQQPQQQQQQQQQYYEYEHHEPRQHQHHQRQGWSKEECFNFRFTDKSQSAPSLPSRIDDFAHDPRSLAARTSSRATSFVSTSNLFENYTRVASVPVDLNLCGFSTAYDDLEYLEVSPHDHEMAEIRKAHENKRVENVEAIRRNGNEEDTEQQMMDAPMSSVRTQASQSVLVDGKMNREKIEGNAGDAEQCLGDHCSKPREKKPVTTTVKTQDRGNCVLDMAIAIENNIGAIDEAIEQFKREVAEANVLNSKNTESSNVDGVRRTLSGRLRAQKVKNTASYELAQQYEIDERNFRPNRFRKQSANDSEPSSKSPKSVSSGRRRVLNNASYELAQQCDYIKALQSSKGAFQRMDACDELEEPVSGRSSQFKVTDFVQQMGSNSTSNLNVHEPYMVTRKYSKSTEDIFSQFSNGPFTRVSINQLGERLKKQEEDSLLIQVKKNSDPFSTYGDDRNGQSVVDDEVDYPRLETKPVGAFSLDGGVSREETNAHESKKQSPVFRHETGTSGVTPKIPDTDQQPTKKANSSKRPYIGDYYPEKIERLQQPEEYQERLSEVESDGNIGNEERSSPCNKDAGERLWRVVVEKQTVEKEASVKKVTTKKKEEMNELEKEEEEERKEREKGQKEEAAEAARGHTVHGVRFPPPSGRGNSDGLESSERSGNPVVAVVVDTNHRGDHDKRYEESARATTAEVRVEDATMSAPATTTKRSSVSPTPTKDPLRYQRGMVVDASSATTVKEERKKGGLGGFLQRFSRLRFSGRSKVPRSEVQKKNESLGHVNREKVTDGQSKKEPDYIIIPLHPPEEERQKEENVVAEANTDVTRRPVGDVQRSSSNVSANGRAPVSSKPPLPPQPPRVGALSSRPSTGASPAAASSSSRRRAATDLGNPAAIEMARARTMQAAQERPVGLLETDLDEAVPSTTTTASTNISVTAAVTTTTGKKTRSLLNLNHTSTAPRPRPEHALHVPQSPVGASHRSPQDDGTASTINQRPHKSMEFLLDKENLHFVKPPENELQKIGERVPSEHELRVQRSLQRLNVPDWYKNSPAARDGFRLKRHSDASQHGGWRALGSKTTSLSSLSSSSNRQPTTGALLSPSPTPPVFSRWSTSLLNSAGSSPASSARSSFNHRQPYLGWRSQERLTNPRTPAERLAQGILPQLQATNKVFISSPQQQQQQQTTNQQLEVRNSIKEVTSAIVHYVQSGQEVAGGGRLSPRPRPEDWDDRGGARSTSPRGSVKLCWMESSFVGTRPVDSPETPMSLATETDCCPGCNATATESCSCVDSATSGLFLDLTPTRDDGQQQQQLGGASSLCPSPSFSLNYHHHHPHHHHRQLHQQQQPQQQQRPHRGSGQSDTDEAMATAALLRNKPSPGSTTLEDVLDSLLGLPSASRTPSPGPGPVTTGASATMRHRTNVGQANAKAGKSCSDLRQDLQESARSVMDVQGATEERASYYVGELVRRKSEGSDTIPSKTSTMQSRGGPLRHRRVSFDSNQEANSLTTGNAAEKMVRCRNNKCSNSAIMVEARKTYKSCHNCTCLYCSRECRKAHWQRHRRTCLHSRAGSLCKQVLSSAKEDPITLKHISALAKRGHALHGRGAVKCFFSSPEAAEKFIANGFVDLGEPTYIRWSDLLASEMGADLYAEVIRLCKSYNPDTRLVLYVAVCVVSEVPTNGAVRWERQLVSRCAKIHLDSASRHHTSSSSASPQGRQQSTSPCNITREMESPEMLVLTSLPGSNGQNTPKRIREISFTNIQRQLKLRGVSLRRHFPQVYRKLRAYVDGTVDKFAPVTIYPRDQASGKSFMCIIMLDVEPERLQLLPTDSSRVRTVDISVEQE